MSARANSFIAVRTNPTEEHAHYENIRYDVFVERLFKADTFKEMCHHAKGGVCEEAGELSDAIKRHITYGKPLTLVDKDGQTIHQKIIEELGDIRFYIQAVMNLFSITEDEVLQHNARKLSKRYAGLVYTDDKAQNRADKPEGA